MKIADGAIGNIKLRLSYKFSLILFSVIGVLGIFVYHFTTSTVKNILFHQHEKKGASIASGLASQAVTPLLTQNISQLQLLLVNMENSDEDIIYLFIVDAVGKISAHTFRGGFPRDLKKLSESENTQQQNAKLIETEKGILLDVSVPILNGSIGYVHIGLSRENLLRQLAEIRQLILLICSLACVFAILIADFISRRITKPLGALVQGANLIKEGKLDYRIPVKSKDEIGALTESFNNMAAFLKADKEKRIKAERALKESENLYRSLVENIDMGITLVDPDHKIVMANAAQGRFFDKEPSEFFGKKCFQEFEKRDFICPHCPGAAAMKSGKREEAITEGKLDDGSVLKVHIRAFPVIGENGQSKAFIEVIEDISEQVKTQQALAAEKERLAVTLRSIGDGVITTDVSGKIVLINKIAEKLTGWSNEEAVGRPLEEIFHIINGQTREVCENPVKKVLHKGKIVGLTKHAVLVAKDGRELNIADSGAPILNDKSEIIGIVLVFRDVTEKLRTEKELFRIKKLESIGVLAGGIAHDFNNMLVAILGNINLALLDTTLEDKTRDLLSDAEKASFRAKNLTSQLLTFSKGGAPVKETASLESVIKESAGFVLRGEKVTCQYNIPDDLWLVDIDKGQISQVIQNIVINACHAMPEGGTISISCENFLSNEKRTPFAEENKFVKISIQDRGIGIPKNIIEKIFDPYFSTKQEGSGLGLAICQSIIKKHQGDIFVESSPGQGTTFTICIPASEEISLPSEKINENFKSSVQAKILLMDDDEMVRNVAENMLKAMGHKVILSLDGAEAVNLYKEAMDSGFPINVAIMDLTIPGGMGGKEAVQKIHKINPEAKVIVSSGYSNDPVMANYKDYGFCATILKPFTIQNLAKVVGKVLERKT